MSDASYGPSGGPRSQLWDAVHFALRVVHRHTLEEDDFDKLTNLLLQKLDNYLDARKAEP